ncbi:class I SAM-dependent methyltransferase [Streptomyces sp. M10(2022)]
MAPQDALLGWDEDTNAEAYNAFTRDHPMYDVTSRDLARRGHLADASLVVDLCGGAGATARAMLDLIPARARVVSVDNAAAMQRVGRRILTDARLTWVTSPAEQLADHLHASSADAVVCNSAIWKTDTAAVFAAVARILRPGGHFVFNIGGGFAGVRHPTHSPPAPGPPQHPHPPSRRRNRQIHPTATRRGQATETAAGDSHRAADRGGSDGRRHRGHRPAQHHGREEGVAVHPLFARPEGGFTHAQRMQILDAAYAMTTPTPRP